MRVLQVIDKMPETSGGARFVTNLVKGLLKKKVEVDLLLIDGKSSHFIHELEDSGVNIISLAKNINRFNPKYISKIAPYLSRYDIVHVHIFPSSYMVAFARILNSNSAPIIFTEHSSFNRRASNFLFKNIEKIVYSLFDHVVCLSAQVEEFVVKNLNINSKKLTIIENAINIDSVKNSKSYSKQELGFYKEDILVLMSARLAAPKNHKLLIDAFKLLPANYKLLFAGDGDLKAEILQYMKDQNMESRVFLLGSRSDIFSLMKSVDVNVLASNFEGLSLSALEAMSTGKPFIASNVDGLDFVVNNTELLFDNDPKKIALLLLKLMEDQDFYFKMSQYTHERSKDFDLDTMVEKYIEVYEKQIGTH